MEDRPAGERRVHQRRIQGALFHSQQQRRLGKNEIHRVCAPSQGKRRKKIIAGLLGKRSDQVLPSKTHSHCFQNKKRLISGVPKRLEILTLCEKIICILLIFNPLGWK